MRGRVVIKLGGSLITDKSMPKGLDRDALDGACSMVGSIIKLGFMPIIIHGAGSFGHIMAKKWGIQDGAASAIIDEQIDDFNILFISVIFFSLLEVLFSTPRIFARLVLV